MRVVAMAGRVSGSSVRTQNRFCGLWMGCTVGLGPPGEGPDGGQGERPTVGRGAPWWPAREPAWAGSRVRQHLQEAAWVLPAPS